MAEKRVVRYKLVKHKWPDEIQEQRNRRIKRISIVAFCVLCFCGGFLISSITLTRKVTNDSTFDKLSSIYEVMKDKFYFGKDIKNLEQTLMNGAISGLVDAGEDSHTAYMVPEYAQEFANSMAGSYVGIGIQYYELDEHTFMVDKVFKNSPAESSGILPGDIIYAVNGKLCKGMDSDKVKENITGAEGSSVEIEIIRDSKHIKKNVKREAVKNSVTSEIQGDVGIVEINTFADTSGEEFGEHMKDLAKKCDRLVLDLRDNGGGYLVAAQQIASYLLPKDTVIFKEEDKKGKITSYNVLDDYKHYTFDKIVVLINDDTASASEVLTMALKENLNVQIVGITSYGKGTIQVPLAFKDGSQLKYTTARWLTPKGKSVDKKGITPDTIVELDPAITTPAPKLEEKETFQGDTVNVAAKSVQTYLKFLGYPVDRCDEYFSPVSSEALKAFQRDHGLQVTGEISAKDITLLITKASTKWHEDKANDTQFIKAVELANGR